MANLSKLTSYDKADWYRGQALMNEYPSYAEFLAYLTNPLTIHDPDDKWGHRDKPAQYVKTKAEQTQKANEAWAKKKNELQGVDEGRDNKVGSYYYDGNTQTNKSRVNLPWWNPYENREWTLKEIVMYRPPQNDMF